MKSASSAPNKRHEDEEEGDEVRVLFLSVEIAFAHERE
jgi:hypothetical protein